MSKLKVEQYDSKHVKIEEIYKIENEIYESIIKGSENIEKMVKEYANNKIKFMKRFAEGKKESSYANSESFFSQVLLYNELRTGTDLGTYSLEELRDSMFRLEDIDTKATYDSYINILVQYIKWAKAQNMRPDFIKRSDLNIKCKDIINKDSLKKTLFTNKEIDYYIGQIKERRTYITLKLCTYGLTFNEILNIKIDDVMQARFSKTLHLLDREIELPESIIDECVKIAKMKTRQVKGGVSDGGVRESPNELNSKSDYMIQTSDSKGAYESKNVPAKNSAISNKISRELKKLAINSSFDDFRESSILNDWLDSMDIQEINKKYNKAYQSDAFLASQHKISLEILLKKRKEEGTTVDESRENRVKGKLSKKNLWDVETLIKLNKEFHLSMEFLGSFLLNCTKQYVSVVFGNYKNKRVDDVREDWVIDSLSDYEEKILNNMILSTETKTENESCKMAIARNDLNEVAIVILDKIKEEKKCLFLNDPNNSTYKKLADHRLHDLDIEELELLKILKSISINGKVCLDSSQTKLKNLIKKQSEARELSEEDYYKFLGFEKTSEGALKKEYIEYLKEYLEPGTDIVYLNTNCNKYSSLVNKAERSGMSLEEYIKSLGFTYNCANEKTSETIRLRNKIKNYQREGNVVFIPEDDPIRVDLEEFAKQMNKSSIKDLLKTWGYKLVDDFDNKDKYEIEWRDKNIEKGEEGERFVVDYLRGIYGENAVTKDEKGQGYDIDLIYNGDRHRIEIKTRSSKQSPIHLTRGEIIRAIQYGENYWLYYLIMKKDIPLELYRVKNLAKFLSLDESFLIPFKTLQDCTIEIDSVRVNLTEKMIDKMERLEL